MLIAQKTSARFKMTYSTDENLYITVGYGPQEGGGYSICVNEQYTIRKVEGKHERNIKGK